MLTNISLTTLSIDDTCMSHDDTNKIRQWYYEKDRHKDTLIIAAGDSWTWGDSLGYTTLTRDDYEHRVSHIYGAYLANELASDFINIGLPGLDNISIINRVKQVLSTLNKNYQQICVVFTLTETGRELTNTFKDYQSLYQDTLAGPDWPKFESIVTGTVGSKDLSRLTTELKNESSEFLHIVNLWTHINQSASVNELILNSENYTFKAITELVNEFGIRCVVSRNFTSFFEQNKKVLTDAQIICVPERWVDVIQQQGNLSDYPQELYAMSGMAIDPISNFSKYLKLPNCMVQLIDLIDCSMAGVSWLEASEFNSRWATKHPLEQAHKWWARHLLPFCI
jgi:hypothetical protein